jgi:hypothetical protein
MKAAFVSLLTLAVIVAVGVVAFAQEKKEEKKEVELKGTIACPKCSKWVDEKIHGKKCMNAIKVKEKKDGKDVEVIYVLIDKGKAETYHVCTGAKTGSVKGVVTKKGEQLYITPTKDGVKVD